MIQCSLVLSEYVSTEVAAGITRILKPLQSLDALNMHLVQLNLHFLLNQIQFKCSNQNSN